MQSGRIWPYAIGLAITCVFGFCVATIVVTNSAHIQESDDYMAKYQDADANINALIESRIAFDKNYKIKYIAEGIRGDSSVIKYQLTDLNSNPVNDATIIVATSRPETEEFNQKLENPTVENGVYSFDGAKFPKAGVWNIVAKIDAGDKSRFFNIKADTRIKEAYEF